MATARSAQSQYGVASWQVGDEPKIYFPVLSVSDQRGNRLVEHQRPNRAGAKIQSTGSRARRWSLGCIFTTQMTEPGADNGRPLFPDVYRMLQRSFDSEETGDLVIPGLGAVRAKAESMNGVETFDEIDTVRPDLVFVEDNEDTLDRALLRPPTARATTKRQAEQTVFSAHAVGGHDLDLDALVTFAAELEGALQEPGRSINKVQAQVRRNRRAIQRVVRAGSQARRDVTGPFSDPRGSAVERQLLVLRDRQAAAAAERSASLPRSVQFVVDVDQTSLFDLAARFSQDAEVLLDLNDAGIADPFNLRRGDVVLVYATPPDA